MKEDLILIKYFKWVGDPKKEKLILRKLSKRLKVTLERGLFLAIT